MADFSLEAAKAQFQSGLYADALALALRTPGGSKTEAEERECLICDCLQFTGEFDAAVAKARAALDHGPNPEHASRYWQVIGRTALDQLRLEDAVEALRRSLRVAEKGAELATLATAQQLWLVTVGPTLGAGLSPIVREAYRTAVRSGDARVLAGFHLRLSRLEAQRGAFGQSQHHLALAKSLLDRLPHTALLALYYVNQSCVLSLLGSSDRARRSGETGVNLAEQAGH